MPLGRGPGGKSSSWGLGEKTLKLFHFEVYNVQKNLIILRFVFFPPFIPFFWELITPLPSGWQGVKKRTGIF